MLHIFLLFYWKSISTASIANIYEFIIEINFFIILKKKLFFLVFILFDILLDINLIFRLILLFHNHILNFQHTFALEY